MPLRRSARKAFTLQCQVVMEENFKLISEETLDLSESGARVRTSLRVLTGEPIVVTIRDPRTMAFVDATGVVARVEHGRRRRERGRALGLEFDPLDAESKKILDGMLKGRRFAAA